MREADKGGRTARRNKLKRDNRGSAIVIVIIAMATAKKTVKIFFFMFS